MTSVTAIVPARNEEASIAQAVLSLAAQPDVSEIIVVNDQSTDRTSEILAELGRQLPQLKTLDAPDLPAGWIGKTHALWIGAQAARGEWLLFTDADVTHLPGSTARALADAERHTADLVSYSPDQEMPTWWERAMIPFVYTRLSRHFPYGHVDDPCSPPAANGQYLMVRREAYFSFGGHQSIAGEVLEDVAMARHARSAGVKIYFARGEGIARTRMYRSFGQMWQGWQKNLYPLVGGSPMAMFRELGEVFPWELVLLALSGISWLFALTGLLFFAGKHTAYAARLRENRYPFWCILYYLPAAFLYTGSLVASADAHGRGRVVWKGRDYPVSVR